MKRLVSMLVCVAVLAAAAQAQSPADLVKPLRAYDYSQPRAPIAALERALTGASAEQLRAFEKELAAVVSDPATTPAGIDQACRLLRRCGTAASAPALIPLLSRTQVAHCARFALQGIPGDDVNRLLRDALTQAAGAPALGIVSTLGARRDEGAVPPLAALAGGGDAALAAAAVVALGDIGRPAAAKALADLKPSPARDRALLGAAQKLAAEGGADAAAAVCLGLIERGADPVVRAGALHVLSAAAPAKAADRIAAALAAPDADLAAAAAQALGRLPDAAAVEALAAKIGNLPPAAQPMALAGLRARTDRAGARAVAALAKSPDAAVRKAAVEALGDLGGAAEVPMLLAMASDGDLAAAARGSLAALGGKGVTEALVSAAKSGDAPTRAIAAEALGARRASAQAGLLLDLTKDPEQAVRGAAFRALREVAGEAMLQPLTERLLAGTPAEAGEWLPLLQTAVDRSADAEAAAKVLSATLSAPAPVRAKVLPMFARLGTASSLAAVTGQLANPDPDLHKAAVRALADWPHAEALEPLMSVATSDADASARVLALRGYIRVTGLKSKRKAEETVALYGKALAAATRDEERMMVLGGLAGVSHRDALALAAPLIEQPALQKAAALALAGSARHARPQDAPTLLPALQKAKTLCTDPVQKKDLDAAIQKLGKT